MTIIGNAYRWIHGRIAEKPTNYSWVIKDQLAGSGMPMTYSQFLWVLSHGIRAIITVREVPLPAKWFDNDVEDQSKNDKDKIDYLHVKVEDYGAPSIEQLNDTVEYIRKQIGKGKPVLVHCAAGKGRTGTVLAAYLIKERDLDAEEALFKIRMLRPGSVQSEKQEKCIEQYERYVKGSS
jgi:atypical dual specificity phosphatase